MLLENEFLLTVPQSPKCGVAKVKLQYTVGVILVAKLIHPISLLQFARGTSIILYLEVKSKTQTFFLLKVSLRLFCSYL